MESSLRCRCSASSRCRAWAIASSAEGLGRVSFADVAGDRLVVVVGVGIDGFDEQNADARPAIVNPLSSVERYDVFLLAGPIWNVRAPMIMSSFAEGYDFRGKTVRPVTTHAMSGLGTTERDYAASCPEATIGEGLAVRGEEVGKADAEVRSWLRRIGAAAE
ncbi:hypothetical protein OHU89_45100 [Streptomyces sp. NBC_00019]